MPKGSKSSASAGTRKKHAKKSTKDNDTSQAGPSQKSKKLTKAEKKAKVKQYVPPPKPPAPSIPDPLDSQGLVHTLPPELVVILRRIGKKDVVTKRKGLEELREDWVVACRRQADNEDEEVEREIKESALVSAAPVWLHNFAQILQSPSHRSLALQIHQELLSIPSVRSFILDTFTLFLLPGDQCRNTLGSWLVAAVEERRRAGGASLTCWTESVSFSPQADRIDLEPHLESVIEYLSLSISDPASLRDSIFPSPVATDPIPLGSEEEGWYRVGGLTGLAWIIPTLLKPLDLQYLKSLLSGDHWTSLSPLESAVGYGQPSVRRAAYGLLGAIIDLEDEVSEECLPTDLLTFCWKETESTVWDVAGPAIAKCLRKHPNWWDTSSEDDDDDEDEDESDDSPFSQFLQFVATICPCIPHLTYPLLMVAISSMPPEVLPLDIDPSAPLPTFASHLWSPVDARLLSTHALPNQQSSLQTFLQSALDCIVLLCNRARKEENDRVVEWLVHEQMGQRAWKQCVLLFGGRSGRSRTAPVETEATIFGEATARLANVLPRLQDELIKSATNALVSSCFGDGCDPKLLSRALRILDALALTSPSQDGSAFSAAVAELSRRCVEGLQAGTVDPVTGTAVLVEAVGDHYDSLPEALKDNLFSLCSADSLSQTPGASLIHLLHALEAAAPSKASRIQKITSDIVISSSIPRDTRFAFLTAIFQQHHESLLAPDSLDEIAEDAIQAALSGEGAAAELVSLCIRSHKLSASSLETVLSLCSTAVRDATHNLLTTVDAEAHPTNLDAALSIFCTYANSHLLDVVRSDVFVTVLVDLHHLKVLWQPPQAVPDIATSTYDHYLGLPIAESSRVHRLILGSLSALLVDGSCVISPKTIVHVASRIPAQSTSGILPEPSTLETCLDEYLEQSADPSLAILDPLVPSTSDPPSPSEGSFDSAGRSVAGRILEGILAMFTSDRQLAAREPRLLCTSLLGQVLLQDEIQVATGSRGLIRSLEAASDLVRESDEILSFSFANLDDMQSTWNQATIRSIQAEEGTDTCDWVQTALLDLLKMWRRTNSDVCLRSFRNLLSRTLDQSATQADAQVWLDFAMRTSSKNPDLSTAIILSVKAILEDSPALSTARNRLANALTGIKATAIATDGLLALQLLIASAPAHDATTEFVPEQRAIFVLRHVTSWLLNDTVEDLPEELEFRLADLYAILAPIVQNQTGQHWDSIFDLLESGLETSSLQDSSTWCLLHSSLVLLRTIRDLCATNKSLRAAWTNQEAISKLVLALFVQCRNDSSEPMKRIQALLLDLVMGIDESRDKTSTALAGVTVPQLCDLLHLSTNWAVQTMAYRLLSQVIHRDTLALVLQVEATIGDEAAEEAQNIQLPASLIEIVRAGIVMDWHLEPSPGEVVCQILAWMAILDHFDDASRTIRSAYLDQLRTTNLIEQSLLSMLFSILGVSQIGAWNFPASQFSVDEFYPELLEPEDLADLTPFASFLFYRTLVSVPAIMREIHEGIKDRQLSLSLLNFTARHYSPVIIQNEFASLRQPATIAQLSAEGLSVRVAQGGGSTIAAGTGSAEAIASYTVDEQPMEIGIRLPAEFPLRGVDVRDLRRVGVPENKWRGWLMSVQQTITSRNGLILEALTVFKRNVSLHFEGVVECAICYSIISLTDRTLPTKPCRTCKNRFHASCLFKWFNSSHSSSCPLCRTLF